MHRGQSASSAETYMNERRIELRASWEEMASRANVQANTLRRARRGLPIQELNARAIEDAFGWEAGSLADIAEGRPPHLKDAQRERRTDPPPIPLRDDAERKFWDGMGAITSEESKILLLQLYRRERQWGESSTGT